MLEKKLGGANCLRILEKIEILFAAMVAAMRKMTIPPGVGSKSLKAGRAREGDRGVQEDLQPPPLQELPLFVPLTLKASILEAGGNTPIKSSAARFGAITRGSFPGLFSPKVELIVSHLSEQVEKWGCI